MAKKIRKTGTSSETLAANSFKQKADDIVIEEEASMEGQTFTDHLILLYGVPKIGKTSFANELKKGYFIATEPGYKSKKCRKTYVKNWPTFVKFVKTVSKSRKALKSIDFFAIDTVDNLSKFCMQYSCGRLGIAHPSDAEWGKGWEAFRDEFSYWILQLCALQKGVVFISHEADKEVVYKGMKVPKCTPSLPKTSYTVVNNLVDVIVRMGYDIEINKKGGKIPKSKLDGRRCLMTKPSPFYDAGDRTGTLPEKIYFKTEREAVKAIASCFS